MAALGAAGIGQAVGAVGNALGSLFDAMVPKDQLSKVKDFGAELLPADAIKNNATAVVHYAKAMLALGAAGAAGAIGSLGNFASGVIDGVVGFFGGSNPIEKAFAGIKSFTAQTFDVEKVSNNAKAVVAYAKAMGAIAAGDGAGFLGSLGNAGKQLVDGLVSFFGGETSGGIPVDKINEFGKLQLDSKAVEKNAKTIAAFGNAMGSMEDFDDVADDMLDGVDDVLKFSKKISGLKVIKTEGIESLKKVVDEFFKPMSEIDLTNLDVASENAAKFARVFGRGAMKVNMDVDTIFKTEIDTLGEHIDTASADQIAQLKEQNRNMQRNHKDDLVELRNQTALLYQYIANPQKSVIKMDSYKVGESLYSRY